MSCHHSSRSSSIWNISISPIILLSISHIVKNSSFLVSALPNLVSLNAEKNNVKDFKALNVEEGWKTLRILNLSYNKIGELGPVNVPNLMEFSLIENKVEKI